MTERELIAERTFYVVSDDGHGFEIRLRVGKPYQMESGDWACPVALSGLHGRLPEMHGVDSWQALMLAIRATKTLLGFFVEGGGKLFFKQGGDELSLNDIFWDALSSSEPEVPQADEPLSPDRQALVDQLTAEELQSVDDAIMANCSVQFRKVARVVGGAMNQNAAMDKHLPDAF